MKAFQCSLPGRAGRPTRNSLRARKLTRRSDDGKAGAALQPVARVRAKPFGLGVKRSNRGCQLLHCSGPIRNEAPEEYGTCRAIVFGGIGSQTITKAAAVRRVVQLVEDASRAR